jgi:hypothetical protein
MCGMARGCGAALEAEQRLRGSATAIAGSRPSKRPGRPDCRPERRSPRIHQPRWQGRHHGEARAHLGLAPEMRDVGIEVGHADQRAVAERRERVEHVVGGERADDAVIEQPMRGRDAARHMVVVLAPHEEEIGGGQHRHRHAGIGQPAADRRKTGTIDGRKLGDVTDRDPAPPSMGVGLPAHLVEVHP